MNILAFPFALERKYTIFDRLENMESNEAVSSQVSALENDFSTKPLSQEQEKPASSYHESLWQSVQHYAEEKIRQSLIGWSGIFSDYKPEIFPKEIGSLRFSGDRFIFSPEALLELQQLGIFSEIRAVPPGLTQRIDTLEFSVTAQRLDDHRAALWFDIRSEETYFKLKEKLQSQLTASPLLSALTEAIQRYYKTDLLPTHAFTLRDNPLISAVILDRLGMFGIHGASYPSLDQGSDPQRIINELLQHSFSSEGTLNDRQEIESVSWPLDFAITLVIEPVNGPVRQDEVLDALWRFRLQVDTSPYTQELGNQSRNSRCELFIQRETGKEMANALESAGMKFAPDFEEFVITRGSYADRHGGPYAQISRVLAKIIWSGNLGKINEVFGAASGETLTKQHLESFVAYPAQDHGLQALQNMLQQLMERDSAHPATDPLATESRVHILGGACCDVTEYYVGALQYRQLFPEIIEGKRFVRKTHGAETYINVDEVSFRGITLPRGSLFIKGEDGKLAFLRFTPFMFDSHEDMISTFGTEVVKAERQTGSVMPVLGAMKTFFNLPL